ncbi:hypothetical protein ACJQWK_03716 [Exserohilum turcicum]
MSLYPNILDISAYQVMAAQDAHTRPRSEHELAKLEHHEHTTHMNRHHLAENVVDWFSHMFAPASCQQCTCSQPCWAPPPPPPPTAAELGRPSLVVDDDLVLLKGDQDGGPLCREARISAWKEQGEQDKEAARKKRRRSMEWLASVIKKENAQ